MTIGTQQRILTILIPILLALCLLVFTENMGDLFQLVGGRFFKRSMAAVGERQRQGAEHVKEVAFEFVIAVFLFFRPEFDYGFVTNLWLTH